MGFLHLRLKAIYVLLCILSHWHDQVAAISAADGKPTFGDVVPVAGAMARTDQDFQDGLVLDLFSPKPRTLTVHQNLNPLPGQFVTGINGEPFVALSNYSYIVKMNETANDLIAKIEIPYDPQMLNKAGIQEANTYVGTLAADNNSWFVNDQHRNGRRSENLTRIIKKTSLDGEYILLGRKTIDAINIFVQYGQGEIRTVNLTGGRGTQEAEFIDGLRLSVQAYSAMKINIDIMNGINLAALPNSSKSLNSFAWVVNTSDPTAKIHAEMRVPFNRHMLADLKINCSSQTKMLTIARRALNDTRGQFQPLVPSHQVVHGRPEDRISVKGLKQLDGQYVILVIADKCPTPGTACSSSTTKTTSSAGNSTTWTQTSTGNGSATTTKASTSSGSSISTKTSTSIGSSTSTKTITSCESSILTKASTSSGSSISTNTGASSGSSTTTTPPDATD